MKRVCVCVCVIATFLASFNAHSTTGYFNARVIANPGTTKQDDWPHSTGITNNFGSSLAGVVYATDGVNVHLFVPLDLPQSCLLEQIRIFGDDDDSTAAMTFILYRALYNSEDATVLSTWSSVDSGDYHYSAIIDTTMYNHLYSYWVEIVVPAGKDLRVWSLMAVYDL